MRIPTAMPDIPELMPVLDGANHIDVKTAEGTVSMRAAC